MTSKEMEARSGVPRANIRYYEAEGLLSPVRRGNGYRDYSEEDLRTLEKIKLLRRLGVSVEELRALGAGEADLAAVLDRRLAELGGQRASLDRVQRVCGDLRRTGATYAALDPGRYLADLDAPALPEESGTALWKSALAPALPQSDRLPTVCSASRRFFARMFDEFLMILALIAGMCLAGINPGMVSSLGASLAATVLLAFLEPLSLRIFGTTPGKALLGMRLTGPDGKPLPYGEGLSRYVLMMWQGRGFIIPIWSLVQMVRSWLRCRNGEPQPWDDGVAYFAKPFRARCVLWMALAAALALTAGEAVNSACQLPPNKGDLTVAEFAENYNRQAAYLGFGGRMYLDEAGQWQDRPQVGNQITISLEDLLETNPWDDAKIFHYTREDGRVTAVSLTGSVRNIETHIETPERYVPRIVMALTWGREEASFWSWSRLAQMTELEEADWEHGFTLRQSGAVITAQVEQTGLLYDSYYGWWPAREENHLSFTYTVALEE